MERRMKNVARDILRDKITRRIAIGAVVDDLDEIYGYGKRSEGEVGAEIEGRLIEHPLANAWIGLSVAYIIKDNKVGKDSKLEIAKDYLNAVCSNYFEIENEGEWLEEDARGVTETALFLDDNSLFHWNDEELVSCVIFCSYNTDHGTIYTFLSRLIPHLNENKALFDFISQDEVLAGSNFGMAHVVLEREKERGRNVSEARNFAYRIANLLVSEGEPSSLALLCELKWFNTEELVGLFLDQNLSFAARRMKNRVVAYDAFIQRLIESRNVKCEDLILGLLNKERHKVGRLDYSDEPMLKAICNAAERNRVIDDRIIAHVRKFLDYSMETDTKFFLFKFLYRNTNDPEILKLAGLSKSKHIKKWVDAKHQPT